MIESIWPLFSLRIRTPRLTLRVPTDDIIADLCDLISAGVHPPDFMPFPRPWTDGSPTEVARKSAQQIWRQRADWAAHDWRCSFAVFEGDTLVGVQSMSGADFARNGEVRTGSWLGLAHQGRGIGTEMRAATLHFAFDTLGAKAANSGAFHDNPSSRGVSLKLGYVENGIEIAPRRDAFDTIVRYRLDRDAWEARRRDDITVEGFETCADLFGTAVAAPAS